MTETSYVIKATEKPNSYEFGKVGNRHKIYYAHIHELTEILKQLKDLDLIEPTEGK